MHDSRLLTGKEVELRDAQFIVSRTDLSGRITSVNQDFVDISGYSEAELLGQPHNIIRHPDMPAEVFADLWADLKAGRPWIGMIKNRCKNGDAYWVEAHVAPVWEHERIVGYMSRRHKASPARIAAAAEAYADLRGNPASALLFEHGIASRRHAGSSLRRAVARASLGSKLILASLSAAAIILALS